MDNTQGQLEFTQAAINDYLTSKGMNPVDAVYNTMLDLVYLMEGFIKGGGTHTNASELNEDGVPMPAMQVCYGDNCLVLERSMLSGYPLIELYNLDCEWLVVHPDHLDITLCQLLGVPINEA